MDVSAALGAINAAIGRQITYRRGGTSIALRAHRGQRVTTPETAEALSLAILSPSWIVRGADLVSAGTALTPQEGDEIDHVTARGPETYRVTLDPVSGRTWTPSDNNSEWIRINTTRTS